MNEPAILNAKGIFKGQSEKGVQFYNVFGEDADGDQVVLIFGCKQNFTETVDKAFSRLFPITFQVSETTPPPEKEVINIPLEGDTIYEA